MKIIGVLGGLLIGFVLLFLLISSCSPKGPSVERTDVAPVDPAATLPAAADAQTQAQPEPEPSNEIPGITDQTAADSQSITEPAAEIPAPSAADAAAQAANAAAEARAAAEAAIAMERRKLAEQAAKEKKAAQKAAAAEQARLKREQRAWEAAAAAAQAQTANSAPQYSQRREPSRRFIAKPDYPRAAERSGIEGYVEVTVDIDAGGRVIGSRITRSSGNRDLNNAALQAAAKSYFYPGTDERGNPAGGRAVIPFDFKVP